MPEYQVIKKGRIDEKSDVPVKAVSYVIADGGTKRFILLKLRNKSKAVLNALSLKLSEYGEDGGLLRTIDVEQSFLEEGGKFVLPQKIAADRGCSDIKVEVQRADYGSYRYEKKGKAVVLEYTDTEYKPPVYDPMQGKDGVKEKNSAAVRKFKSPILWCFLAVIIFACMVVFTYAHLSYYGTDTDGFRKNNVSYSYVTAGNSIAGVVATGYSGITGVVTIPEVVNGYEVIGIEDGAFAGDSSITEVTIEGDLDTGTGAFRDCTSLTMVYLYNISAINDYTFYNCSSLVQVIAENATYVGNSAFYNCSSLEYVYMYNAETISSYAFYASGITEFTFSSVTSIGRYAFENCDNLTYAEFDNSSLVIGSSAFYNSGLEVVKVYAFYSIGSMAFYQCNNLAVVYDLCGLGLERGSVGYGYIAYYADYVFDYE